MNAKYGVCMVSKIEGMARILFHRLIMMYSCNIHVCMYVCMYVCIYVCMHACLYIKSMNESISCFLYVSTQQYLLIYTYVYIYVCLK